LQSNITELKVASSACYR